MRSHGLRACHFALALAVVLATLCRQDVAAEPVCEVMVQPGEPLQDLAGIACNVSEVTCNCTNTYLADFQPVFWPVTYRVNETMNKTRAGYWHLTDKSSRCAAGFGASGAPTELSCPPGFYCSGGLAPPRSCSSGDHCPGRTPQAGRRCPAGSFCPFPAAPLQPCMDGGYCPEGSTRPQACQPGNYCRSGQVKDCPKGYYCPFASDEPIKCRFFNRCPPNSTHQDITVLTVCFLLLCCAAMYAGKRFYNVIVQSSLGVCSLAVAVAGSMWLVDRYLGGFLTLLLVVVVVNHVFLQWSSGYCPAIVPRLLLFCTFITALYVVWLKNPAWSMLIAGMLIFLAICWLMSLDDCRCGVLLGRLLLVAAFAGLIFVTSRTDPELIVGMTILFIVGACYLIVLWAIEVFRPRSEAVPAGSAPAGAARALIDASMDLTGHVLRPGGPGSGGAGAMGFRERRPSSGARVGMLARELESQPVSGADGVSFSLQGVGFSLPDGTELLKGIDLGISACDRVAVMGPSGSGKSTLLAVLSGQAFYGRVTGRFLINGKQADDLGFLRHVTGYVPQDDVLHGELTVEDNIRFQASLRLPAATNGSEVQSAVEQVTRDLNLSAIVKARVGTPEIRGISGGQRKRVSIAMELVAQPLLLFADEPTSGLDSTTAHEVVGCLNQAAQRQGTTVISVIHQPRYETLCLFSDLVLLATGGTLVYAGPAQEAAKSFQRHLRTSFPQNANPADVMLDAIQSPSQHSDAALAELRRCGRRNAAEVGPHSRDPFYRTKAPFFRAVVIHMDRAILQTMCSYGTIAVNHALCIGALVLLCAMVKYQQIDNFMMQSSFAALFLMLLQAIAAQRIFGADLLNTLREARVGMSIAAYFVAKDLVALTEVTLSAAVFASAYGALSGAHQDLPHLFAGTWAFVYSIFGLSYIFSICLSAGAAQMSAVAATFVSYCVSGIYTPNLPQLAGYLGDRGWMIPALSSVRWFWGYLITAEVHYLTPLSRKYGSDSLRSKGYDPDYLDCSYEGLDRERTGVINLRIAWQAGRGCVCSGVNMLLLGLVFRFLAVVCLSLQVLAKTSGWARFFGQSERGAWKLMGRLFALLVACFLALVMLVEVWIFGIIQVEVPQLLRHLGLHSGR